MKTKPRTHSPKWPLARRVLARLAWAFFVVWAVATLTFVVNNVLPGDPARLVAGQQARGADVARIREQLGLDRPLAIQYAVFIHRLVHPGPWRFDPASDKAHATCAAIFPGLHVDFGKSVAQRRPVVSLLGDRLPRTISLGLVALFLQLALGVPAGAFAARHHKQARDNATMALTLLGVSAPTFLIGIFLQWVFAFRWRLLPSDGFGVTFGEHVSCIILPALTLGVFGAAYYARLVRDEMIDALKHDYVRTARAKGLSPLHVTVRHALRNVLLPLSTVVWLELGALAGGALITERVFRWPGVGALLVDALLARDGPVIVGTVIVTSTAIVLANVAADLLYAALDPRVR